MDTNGGPLSFEAIINDTNWQNRLAAMERRMLGFTNTTVQQTGRIDTAFQNLSKLAAGAFAINGLSDLPQQLIRTRGEIEQLEIAFSVLLKSKSKADALLAQVTDFAAKTPFSFKDAANGSKQLLAYGFAAKDVIPTLSRLGDVAAGLGLPLERLTYLYGTTKTQGRLFAQDLNQFVGSGIPLLAELAKQFGVAEDKVRGLVEEGKVGFAEVKKAIEGMTSGSGIFAGTLDAQSKSINALKEQLGSAYDAVLNQIGKDNQELITGVINTTTDAVKNYQNLAEVLGVVVAAYGSYRAALLFVSVAQKAQLIFTQTMAVQQGLAALSGQALSASQLRLAASTSLLARAQASLNATMLANPYVLVATALATLVSYAIIYTDESQKLKTAQELMTESSKEVQRNFKQQAGEVNTLIGVIKNQNVAESQRLAAYEKLKSIAPEILSGLDFEQAKTARLTESVNTYIAALRKRIQLESGQSKAKEAYDQQAEAAERLKKAEDELLASRGKNQRVVLGVGGTNGVISGPSENDLAKSKYEEAIRYKKQTDKVVADVEQSLGKIYAGTATKEEIQANIDKQERVLASLPKLGAGYKAAEEALNGYRKELAALNQAEQVNTKAKTQSIGEIEAKIKAQNELLDQQTTRAGAAAVQAEIKRLEAQKRQLTGELTSAEKKAIKEAAKSGPFGSIDYYEQVSKKASEILEKLGPKDADKIAQQSKIKFDADQKVEELRKQYALKSFDEELADKQTKYELYNKWVGEYGKASADKQFQTLLASGQSYVDYLNAEIAKLEAQKSKGNLSENDTRNLGSLITQRDEATGKKSAIDVFNEGLQKAQAEAGSLSKYLEILKQKQDELGKSTNSPTDIAVRRQLAEEINKTQQQLKLQLDQYLVDFAGSEQQQVAIRTKYNELRAALDTKYLNNRGAEYKQALALLNSDEEQAVENFKQRQLEQTQAYKDTTKVILEQGEKRAEIEIDRQRKLVAQAKKDAGETSEVYLKELAKLNELIEKNGGTPGQKLLGKYATIFGQLGQSLSQLEGDAGKAGDILTGLANNISLIGVTMDKTTSKTQRYAIAIQGFVGLISSIAEASQQRKKAETDYYSSVIDQQERYNLLLNEELGLRSKNQDGTLIRNYTGELKDNYTQLADAQAKYQESLSKLSQGKAKSGLKDYFDSGAALKTIGSAAAAGSAIVPVIGGLVGGIIGGITSLFTSNKKVEEFGDLLALYPKLIQKSKDGVDELNVSLAQSLIDSGQLDDQTKELVQSTIDWQKQVEAAQKAIKAIVSDLVGDLGGRLGDGLVQAFKDGTDAALAFKGTLEDVLESFVTKLIYTKLLAPYLKTFEDEVSKSLDVEHGGDGTIVDDIKRLYGKSGEITTTVNDGLQAVQDAAKEAGFDILKNKATSSIKNPNTLSQSIRADITEQTGTIVAGQLNAMRITQVDSNLQMRQQVMHLIGIEKNTGLTAENTARIQRTNELLESVDKRLRELSSGPGRGLGQPG